MIRRRSKSRITKAGLLYERRIIALRRIQAQQPPPVEHPPTEQEAKESESRWQALKHLLP